MCNAFDVLARGRSRSISGAARSKRGAYIFFNTSLQFWLRSGKASKTFAERYDQHVTASRLRRNIDLESRFYTSYPSEDADDSFVRNRISYFTDLDCYMSIGYRDLVETRQILCGNSIFSWNSNILSWLHRKHGGVTSKIFEEQLLLIDYLLEHCVELCLEPSKDISTSMGWEKYLIAKK